MKNKKYPIKIIGDHLQKMNTSLELIKQKIKDQMLKGDYY